MIVCLRPNGRQPSRDRVCNLTRVATCPNAGAIDAAAAAVDENALHHHVEIILPVVHLVVAEKDLGKSRPVSLHAWIAAVSIDSGRSAEDQTAIAAIQHGRADIA